MSVRRLLRRRRRRFVLLLAAGALAAAPVLALADEPDDDLPPVADLSVAVGTLPPLVQGGQSVTFGLAVANAGPRHARRVRVAIALTAATRIESAGGAGWSCDITGAMASCTRHRVRRGATADLAITATARPGLQRLGIGAFVTGRTRDPDPADNTASALIAINNAPVLTADSATTSQGTEIDIPVLDNDFDPDGDQLTLTSGGAPGSGTVSCADFGCTYTPEGGFRGTDTFTYTVSDGRGGSASTSVSVTVVKGNNPPPPPPPPPDESDPGVVVSGPPVVRPGQTGGFRIVIGNGCVLTARAVVARITLPAGATLISAPKGATRRGRVLTVAVGDIRQGTPRTLGLRLRFGPKGGSIRTLVVAVTATNARLTGDGIVITVR